MTDAMTFPKGTLVLVTGATGFTGAVLTRKLCERGARVRAIVRASSKRDGLEGLPIEWIEGNVYDPATVERAVAGVEIIFHVAAAYREAGITADMYSKVHVESTKLLAQEALKNPGFKRFVHVSTVGVHGHIENPPANEEYPFSPGDVYQQTKLEAELWLRDFAPKHGLPFTVIRPAAIYGPGDKRLLKIFKMAAWPLIPVLGSARGQLYHLIHVDDLTEIFILASVHPQAAGEVFIGGDPAALALADILRIISSEYGRNARLIRIPVWPFFWAAAVCEAVCRPFGWAPPIYRRRVAFFTKDRSFDTSKLRRRLGYTYGQTTEEGLRATARWYREQGWV
ncbi:MAG: NAD-dependent epimerase/dehydratase family protein [bacterium]